MCAVLTVIWCVFCCVLQHFKTNGARVTDYPNMWAYVRDLYV